MRVGGVLSAPTALCPDCSQVWLVAGLRPGEKCACKGCGRLIPVSGREPAFDATAAGLELAACDPVFDDRRNRRHGR